MIKQQQIIDKANEDFVKLKARMLHLGKEKIFQQSEKIEISKIIRRFLTNPEIVFNTSIKHVLIDMDNIYDVFYQHYKSLPEDTKVEDFFIDVIDKYKFD